MNKIRPLLLRDNRHSQIIFVMMTISMFMIIGPIALYVKAALAGLAVLIFLTMFYILTFVKYTDKTCPRYVVFLQDSIKLIYWNKQEKIIKFKDIDFVEINGSAVKSFDGIVKIKTAYGVFDVRTEIIGNVLLLVKLLNNKSKIVYADKYMENMVKSASNASEFKKNLRLFLGYGLLLIFFIVAIYINLQLPLLIKWVINLKDLSDKGRLLEIQFLCRNG